MAAAVAASKNSFSFLGTSSASASARSLSASKLGVALARPATWRAAVSSSSASSAAFAALAASCSTGIVTASMSAWCAPRRRVRVSGKVVGGGGGARACASFFALVRLPTDARVLAPLRRGWA
jgi:hypothetical protein